MNDNELYSIVLDLKKRVKSLERDLNRMKKNSSRGLTQGLTDNQNNTASLEEHFEIKSDPGDLDEDDNEKIKMCQSVGENKNWMTDGTNIGYPNLVYHVDTISGKKYFVSGHAQ